MYYFNQVIREKHGLNPITNDTRAIKDNGSSIDYVGYFSILKDYLYVRGHEAKMTELLKFFNMIDKK